MSVNPAPTLLYSSVAMSSDGNIQLASGIDSVYNVYGVYLSTTTGSSWSQISNSNLPIENDYNSFAMSSDGSIQLASGNGGGVYLSTTTGSSWTQISSSYLPIANGYNSVAMSSNGTIQLAATDGSGVYLSTNTGVIWTRISSSYLPAANPYNSVAMSSTGQYQLAATNGSGVYLSDNSGNTWTRINSSYLPTANEYVSVAMSSTGQYQLAATDGSGVYLSTNTGVIWTRISSSYLPIANNYNSVAMSSNGTIQLAATVGGIVYLSDNSGNTWSPISDSKLPTDNGYSSVAMSSTGTIQLAASEGSGLYLSTDRGINWAITNIPTQPTPPPPSKFVTLPYVLSIAVDSNVDYMYALYDIFDGGVVIGTNIAKINATTRTIINYSLVVLTGAMIEESNTILLIGTDLYLTSQNKIYKIQNINTSTPGTPTLWFTSSVTDAILDSLTTDETYIYVSDQENRYIMQVSLANPVTPYGTPWATLGYGIEYIIAKNGFIYATCFDSGTSYTSYISIIPISDPSTLESDWITIDGYSASGLAIHGSYMYVALESASSSPFSLGLIYLSDGGTTGILQNPNWVPIPNRLVPDGELTEVIITQKNQNVNLYICDDIIEIPLAGDTPISNICFPAGTPITTDQGIVAIEKINPNIHTINKKPIVDIIKTIYNDKYLIGFKKNAICKNCPSQFTVMTKNHKIIWQGRKLDAESFLYRYENVGKVKYNGEILYNVLMEEHSEMLVNNMLCETLDPNNTVAKLYKRGSKYTPGDRYKISKFIADSVKNTKFNKYKTYRNIIKNL